MNISTYIYPLTKAEYNKINARFHLVEKNEKRVVVGCVGNLYAYDLNANQVEYIKYFYNISFPLLKRATFWDVPRARNYTSFLIFEN